MWLCAHTHVQTHAQTYVYVHTKSIHIYIHTKLNVYTHTYIYICLLHFPYLHMWIHIMHTFHTLILFNGCIFVAISVVSSCFSFVFAFSFVIKNRTTDKLCWLYHFQLLQLMMEIPRSSNLHQRVPVLCISVPIFNILQHIANVYPQQISTNSIFLEPLPLTKYSWNVTFSILIFTSTVSSGIYFFVCILHIYLCFSVKFLFIYYMWISGFQNLIWSLAFKKCHFSA